MRSFLQLTTLSGTLLVAAWAFPGCSSNEGDGGKMDTGAMPSGKMEGAVDKGKMEGAMDKGKMDGGGMESGKMGGALDTGKMDGGAMDEGKMVGTSK